MRPEKTEDCQATVKKTNEALGKWVYQVSRLPIIRQLRYVASKIERIDILRSQCQATQRFVVDILTFR